ncbi:hypothetical protein EG328_008658 [Venturia inaequalis]|uniref:F-box domain-containing protein n=1 Tax=Venturia inaequalis TaxID=5025 RepID=A0A8H3UBR0_VENIN|nr:hypothetical protein EG328_008658 [Venturia inaequalis]
MKLRIVKRSERLRRQALQMIRQSSQAPKLSQQTRATVSLDLYPPELLEKVASFLLPPDLFNLRFVNRRTQNATVHLFTRKHFREMIIEFTYDGLQRFDAKARHYDLSGTVLFGSKVKIITFKQGVWSEHEELAWKEALGDTTHSRKHRRIMKVGMKNAAKLWKSHLDVTVQGICEKLLTKTLLILNNGHGLHSVGLWDHSRCSKSGSVEVRSSITSDGYTICYTPTRAEIADRFAFTLEMISSALQASRTYVNCWWRPAGTTVTNRGAAAISLVQLGKMVNRMEASAGSVPAWNFLAKANTMTMTFCEYHRQPCALDDRIAIVRLLMPAAQCLTVLALFGCTILDPALSMIISDLAKSVYLPKLKILCFESGAAHVSDLLIFLKKHSKSLERIYLRRMILSHGAWANIFLNVANMHLPKLKCFEAYRLSEANVFKTLNSYYDFVIGGAKSITWPEGPWTEENIEAYQRFLEDVAPVKDHEDFIHCLRTALRTEFYYIDAYQERGPKDLHWMVANVVLTKFLA